MTSAIRPLGFALLPDAASSRQIVRLHEQLHARHPSAFVLRPSGAGLPHLSLFQGQFGEHDVPHLVRGLQDTARALSAGPIEAAPKPPELWLNQIAFLDVEPAVDLLAWQRGLMQVAEPVQQTDHGSADRQVLRGLSPDEQHSIDRYAYPFVGPAWRPHITLGRVEQNAPLWPQSQADLVSFRPQQAIRFDRLALFEVGLYGSLVRVIVAADL